MQPLVTRIQKNALNHVYFLIMLIILLGCASLNVLMYPNYSQGSQIEFVFKIVQQENTQIN